jgi:hypothetical protein
VPVATPAARRLLSETAAAPDSATAQLKPATACSGDRRRASDAASRRAGRIRKGTPQATEQLCLAV